MASTRDISHLSDISKLKTESDGSFKRQDAEFRNFIEKGGKFEPETGESWFLQS
jgi:putative glutathione S-transferase